MATITYSNGVSIFPAVGDMAEIFNGLAITSASASTVVLENAFGKITLTATAAAQFTYTTYGDYPVSGNIDTAKIDVYTSTGTTATFATLTFPALTPLSVVSVLPYYYSGVTTYFYGDTLFNQADTINGSAVDDWIKAGAGNDTVIGGAGNDTLDGGAGTDSMTGGIGNDVYLLDSNTDVIVEAVGGGTDTAVILGSYYSVTYTLADNVENLEAAPAWAIGSYSYGNITANGNALNNIMRGATYGSDIFNGLGGNDRLFGNSGNDTLDGGTGDDTMAGGDGNDTYYVDAVGDKIIEVPINLSLDKVITSITYTLANTNLEILELGGTSNINGTGNTGDNTIIANIGNNVMNGGDGIDTLSYEKATAAVSVSLNLAGAQATGGSGSDTVSNFENLTGGTAGDTLKGNLLNNIINGGLGADTMTGYAGNDVYVVNDAGDNVVEAAASGTDTVQTDLAYILGANQENLTLTGSSAVNGTGNVLENYILGNSGNNVLLGLGGNDTLYGSGYYDSDTLDGGAGADSMVGSYGNDTFYVDNVGDIVVDVVETGAYYNTVNSSISYTLGANIHNLTLTGAATKGGGNDLDNTITANANANILNGGLGVDTLSYSAASAGVTVNLGLTTAQATGGSGSDTLRNFENLTGSAFIDTLTGNTKDNVLDGGAGNDILKGGAGNDTYLVDAGDTVVEALNAGVDLVKASVTYTLANNVENLTLLGSANVNGTGNALDNYLTGNSGNNLLTGGDGNDTLDGGPGGYVDTLDGGLGNDTYRVDNAGDVVLDSGGTDTVIVTYSVYSYTAYTLAAGIENLQFLDTYSLNTYTYQYDPALGNGNSGDNLITGNSRDNTILAGDGNDTLIGGLGNDNLTGGNGQDIFVFDKPLPGSLTYPNGYNTDRINDFSVTDDTIQLDDEIFTALISGAMPGVAFKVLTGVATVDADDRIIYESSTGKLYYDQDGSSIQAQVQIATLSTGLAMTAADFAIV